jgi:hypothetical protein
MPIKFIVINAKATGIPERNNTNIKAHTMIRM